MPETRAKPVFLHTALIILALFGVILIMFHTRNGPGITGDSVSYVMGAENLAAGRGYSRTAGAGEAVPISGFPPGFSAALLVFSWINPDIFFVGRLLNAVLFGINVYLAGLILWRYSCSESLSIFGSLLVLLSEDLIHAHAWVMSEGLFITLSLFGIYLIVRYFENSKIHQLILAGVIFACATLTRYVGVALIGTGGILILINTDKTFWRRLQDAIVFGLAAFVPVVLWLMRNTLLGGTATNRELGFHPPSAELIRTFLGTINAWVFPLRLGLPDLVRAPITVLIVVVLPLFFFYRLRIRKDRQSQDTLDIHLDRLPLFLLIYIPLYASLLIANTAFLDAGTSLAGAARYLTPLFPVVVIFVLVLSHQFLFRWNSIQLPRSIGLVFGIFVISMYAVRAYQFVSNPGEVFRYTDMKRNMPDVVEALDRIENNRILISNDIQLLYVLSDRPAYLFPLPYDVYREKPREDFEEQIAFTQEKLKEGAVLVMFEPIRPDQKETLKRLDIVNLYSFDGAEIFIAE